MTNIEQHLEQLEDRGLYRRMRLISGPQGARVLLDGKPVLVMCSNNYLGLADHASVRDAAADAATRWGVGSTGSRLISGNMTVHKRLESRLAEFKGTESALLFGSGYLANAGVIPALARPGDVVFSDQLNHASIIDGCRLSRAEVFVYDHCDMEHLAWGLRQARGRGSLIVTDSVFSMDGDVAPLEQIVQLARDNDARIVVDEAHATGCVGPGGRGVVAEAGLTDDIDVIVGTLSKALGSYGGFAACDTQMARYLLNSARSFIFSTSPAPPVVAAALAALEILIEQPRRVERLQQNTALLRGELAAQGFDVDERGLHIIPLVTGSAASAVAMAEHALERGVFAQAIRPPTVAPELCRIRIAVMASHKRDELCMAARVLASAAESAGFSNVTGFPGEFVAPEPQAPAIQIVADAA
ncbi:MAG: 8-amino-7-oxononanoate synthase [Thermoleophilaceae bacterium]|nr:8-amino-7-oxononanoate synthase [Thermoleophilaceae bacterium]